MILLANFCLSWTLKDLPPGNQEIMELELELELSTQFSLSARSNMMYSFLGNVRDRFSSWWCAMMLLLSCCCTPAIIAAFEAAKYGPRKASMLSKLNKELSFHFFTSHGTRSKGQSDAAGTEGDATRGKCTCYSTWYRMVVSTVGPSS